MKKTIIDFQKSFQSVVNTLKENNNVLAIFTFGSILNGDVWEGSDIDFFVVYKDDFSKVRDVYADVLDIPVHIKFLRKETFLNTNNEDKYSDNFRNLLITSKLVYERDSDIANLYNNARYRLDKNIERRNLIYLSHLLKELGVSKKYLENGGLYTSFEVLIKALANTCNLYINLNGYTVSKDSIVMASNLNNDFKKVVDNLFLKGATKENIEKTIDFIEEFLDKNIERASKLLLDYLYKRGEFISSYEIKTDDEFREYNIKVEHILEELFNRGFISKESREFKGKDNVKILEEKVYAPNYN